MIARPRLVLLVVALTVRAAAFFLQPELTYDGAYYLRQADRLWRFSYDFEGFPPGYPFAVAVLRLAVRDAVVAGRLVSLVAGLATIGLTYSLGRRALGARAAFAAALFLAVHPHFARVHVEVLSESLYTASMLLAISAFLARRDRTAGLSLGGAFLVRPEALVVLLGLLAARIRQGRGLGALALGLLPVAAFAFLASRTVGHFVLSPKQGQLDIAAIVPRLSTLFSTFHATFPLVLVPAALWAGWRQRVLVLPLLPLVLLPFFDIHIQERMHVPALPFWTLLALAGLAALRPGWRTALGAVAAATFVWGAAPGYRHLVRSPGLVPQARSIGRALRPSLAFDDRVAGRFPLVPYFAGASFVRVPRAAGYDALVDSVLAAGATHLLVLESEMQNVLPQLRPLFDNAAFVTAEGRLETAARVAEPPGARALLYALRRPPLDARDLRALASGVADATWLGGGPAWLDVHGALHAPSAAGAIPPPPGRAVLLAGSDDGRLACALAGEGTAALAIWRDGTWRVHALAVAAPPRSACWVGEDLLYVEATEPPRVRALDTASSRQRDVGFEGVEARTAVPLAVAARGEAVAVVFEPRGASHAATRIVATAAWPGTATAPLVLRGRWATELRLFDEAIAWADADLVLASVQLVDSPEASSLCLVQADGRLRRLSYGFVAAQAPVVAGDRVLFRTRSGDLFQAGLPDAVRRIPPAEVFEAASESRPTTPR